MARRPRGGVLPREFFLGRESVMERMGVLVRDLSREWGRGLCLWAPPGTGKTELLRQLHASVFDEGGEVFPVYYLMPGLQWDVGAFTADFTRAVAAQFRAFGRRDSAPLRDMDPAGLAAELRREGTEGERFLAEAVQRSCGQFPPTDIRDAALLPARLAEASGVKILVILDDFPRLGSYRPGELARWPGESLRQRSVAFILAGGEPESMQGLLDGEQGLTETLELPPLEREGAARFVKTQLRLAGAELPGDLAGRAADLAGRRPFAMEALVRGLERNARLDESALCRAYAASACRGDISRYWLEMLKRNFPRLAERKTALEVLVFCLREQGPPVEAGRLAEGMLKNGGEVEAALDGLLRAGMVRVDCSRVRVADDPTLRDFLLALYRVEAGGADSASVEAALAAEKVQDGERERRRTAAQEGRRKVAALMTAWSGQQVPRSLFSVGEFEKLYGNHPGEEVFSSLTEEGGGLSLPEVVSVVTDHSPGGGRAERSGTDIVAWAFHRKGERRGAKVCWVAALRRGAVEKEAVEEFDRRVTGLEAEGEVGDAATVKWLVAEGFSPEALAAAARRRILTSTGQQVLLLGRLLGRDVGEVFPSIPELKESKRLEFDMQIPMVSDTELVAARALEQLAENMNFSPEETGRIKMALVEACINAFEHSGLEEGRVGIRFSVEEESLEIRVENRGRVFGPRKVGSPARRGGMKKRGWGLNLIRELMDEAEFEQTEDGASLVMVKHLKGKEGRSGKVRDND